jgi:hypothetical protein
MESATERLRELIERVFADGVLEPGERQELTEMWKKGRLTVSQVRDVMTAYVRDTYADVMADGVVTDAERQKLTAIVAGLRLPPECVPDEMRRLLKI